MEILEKKSRFEYRLLALKVRIKAIILNITQNPLPAETVLKFLVTYTDNDNYFDERVLFPDEQSELKFST